MEPNLCPCLKIAFSFPIECSDQTSSCLRPQLKLSNTFVKIHILASTALTKACLFFFSAKTEDKKFKKNFQLCRSNYNREALQLIFGRCIKEFDTPCHIFSLSRVVFYALGTMLFYIWLQTIQNAPHCWNVICPFATNGTQRICWCFYNQTQFGEMQRWSL